MKHLFSPLAVALLALGAIVTRPAVAADTAAPLRWQREATSVALLKGSQVVWQFNYGTNGATKPYFHPVALPGGAPLTWAKPADHVWHYGLWFSWKFINGVNYWEENKQGASDGTTSWKVVRITTRPDFSAEMELALDYRPPQATRAVLTEKRVLLISAPAADGSYAIDWRSDFQAGSEDVKFDRTPLAHEPGGKTYGGYAGLSLRLAKDLAEAKVAATAAPGEPVENRYRFSASGADYSGVLGGKETGVAMLDHPANPRFPTRWYTIADKKGSFWFLNASWIQVEPYTLGAGKTVTLRYRVAVHPGRWETERLQTEQARFAKE